MTTSTRIVKIRTRTVGQRFGTAGQVVAMNNRVIETTQTRPYGFDSVAARDAADRAAELGYELAPEWTVRGSVRGVQYRGYSESEARRVLARDHAQCGRLRGGAYSDCLLYRDGVHVPVED